MLYCLNNSLNYIFPVNRKADEDIVCNKEKKEQI